MRFVMQYWRGQKPLWKAFWVWGIVVGVIIIPNVFGELMFWFYVNYRPLDILLALPLFAYVIWNYVSIWRCGKHSKKLWMILSRLFIGIMIIQFFCILIIGKN